MRGAREYVNAIDYLARNKIDGFFYACRNYACKDRFVFELNRHARGLTLRIFLLETPPVFKVSEDTLLNRFLSKENSLTVYDVVSGDLGWTEEYGFVVNSEKIKNCLNAILTNAVSTYNQIDLLKQEEEKERKRINTEAYADKVKAFEALLDE